MRRVLLSARTVAAVAGAAVLVAGVTAQHLIRASAASVVPINAPVDAATQQDWLAGFGAQFAMSSPGPGVVTVSVAQNSAETKYGPFITSTGVPGVALTVARFGKLTLPHYALRAADGSLKPIIKDRDVWLLTYSHANVPYTGGPPLGKAVLANVPSFESEAYVVVGAQTGQAMDMFAVSRRSS